MNLTIQFEPKPAARREMRHNIIQEEIPLGNSPYSLAFVIIKADEMTRDQIEFAPEIRQLLERLDARGHARDFEQSGHCAKHWHIFHIDAEDVMAKKFANVEEITGATAEVENALARFEIEIELANPSEVDRDPVLKFKVFRPGHRGPVRRIFCPDLSKTRCVDRLNNRLGRPYWRPQNTARTAMRAAKCVAGKYFAQLIGKTHAGR